MKAGWKNDPATRAYFEIKRAVWRHNCAANRSRETQLQALDEVAAEIMRAAAAEANKNRSTRH